MANADGAFGLRPDRHLDGTSWNGATMNMYKSASYATALYIGDPVLLSAVTAERDPKGRYPSINKSGGTDGTIVFGVVVGFEVDPDDLNKVYSPASTEAIVKVVRAADDLIFTIRGDGGGTPTVGFPGLNAVMIATTAGDTNTGLSGMELDEGTTTAPSANQSNPLLILGVHQTEDNTLADDAVWEVLINTNDNATGRILGVAGA
jgi:hypothetical protein